MYSFRQSARQPLKTVTGILIVTLAVAVLCVCLGQAVAAWDMEANLGQLCTSSALITEKYLYTAAYDPKYGYVYKITPDLPDSVVQWMYDMAQQYPDIIEGINRPGLASAYIPELTADNYTRYFADMTGSNPVASAVSSDKNATNYTHAMLEITLDEIGAVQDNYTTSKYNSAVQGVSVELTGTVESVLGLQEGYNDPTGYTARMTLILPSTQALEELELEVGRRYLVYAMDYTDLDWDVRVDIALNGHGLANSDGLSYGNPQIECFYEESWVPFPDGYVEDMGWTSLPSYKVGWYEYLQEYEDGTTRLRGVHLTNLDMLKFRTVSFTMYDLSALDTQIGGAYTVPTIVPIDGGAEAFLSGSEGALWQKYLDYIQINHRSFAVMGVDDLMATGDFALEKAAITSGRNFTQKELDSGAKVCVISAELAALSGLEVGDTVTLNFYNYDPASPYQYDVSQGYGTVNPSAYPYGATTEFTGEGETYTIVGLYTRNFAWEGASSLYNFTVNTVFTPKSAIRADMDYGEIGVFLSLVIQNGALEDFEALAQRDGYDGLFECTDQGYETIQGNLHDYKAIANQAAAVGAAVYAVILLLFLLLYPAMQGKNLKTMGSLGADRPKKLAHMMLSSWSLLIPGTVIGMVLGGLLWGGVTSSLTQSARVNLELEMKPGILLAIAGGQLLLASLLAFGVSVPMTRNKSLMDKQGFFKSIFLRLRRTPLAGWSIVAFAAVVAVVLCALNAANEAERADYEIAVQEAPVTVTLAQPGSNDPYQLSASGFVTDLFYEERFSRFTPMKYLTDFQYMTSLTADSVNEYTDQVMVKLVTSAQELPSGVAVTWLDGYDDECLGGDDLYILVPETVPLSDMSAKMDGIQILLTYRGEGGTTILYTTVAGTYRGGDEDRFFCAKGALESRFQTQGLTLESPISVEVTVSDAQNKTFIGITSKASPPNLTSRRDCTITWYDGYDASCFDSEEDMFLLLPESMECRDVDADIPGTQVLLRFVDMVFDGYYSASDGYLAGQPKYRETVYECMATVAGSYTNSIDSRDIYCSFRPLMTCAARIGRSAALDYISATLINNNEIADLRQMCNEWFLDPDEPDMMPRDYVGYALIINSETLENLAITLENSIAINEICTFLVFVLSAGAGFFLGFLMIRSRKREIILMRTLGRANFSIYLSYAFEQMLCILAGAALGGLAFSWQPVERLGIFVGIYFVGLSAALVVFLNSKLLTTVKEDE